MKKFTLSNFSKGMIIYLGLLSLVLIITTVFEQTGLTMIYPAFNLMGSALMIVSLLVWGAVLIYKRLKSKNVRLILGALLALVVMFIGLLIFTYIIQFSQLAMAQKYGVIESPAGRKVAIMRGVDMGLGTEEDFAEMLARMDARLAYHAEKAGEIAESAETAESAESAETTVPAETADVGSYPDSAYGFMYSAFPVKFGIFYDAKAPVEGIIYRGSQSEAKLLYEWLDDTTVRFYLENAEPGDSGEVKLNLEG